ncbi:glycosyltransferase family 4 protein [Botrimarina mediterranea]|uniref:WecA-like glycosyltransferase n=1 Tax=Botrimarina mediterranea TaxID=2528022 RepID=A0A518KER6_9BACT|nr:MraY family glycosyltransferase [Botrimarina mediterranea]QDV76286.1 WecA-like glycosyltransferase [Botrimarina mediterranea]QDV80884.1 WecA-like glycosyltransferase [Planctomycetes bacterium K2D]
MTLSSLIFSEYRFATYAIALLVGWLAALALTPVVRRAGVKLGFVDKPNARKLQLNPIALGGGIAVLGATFTAVAVAFLFADVALTVTFFRDDARLLAGLAFATVATLALGLYDDARDMRGLYKLIAQVAIASVLVYLGLGIPVIALFGQDVELGWLSIPLSIFWLVGSTNAINLLDGIDGLASGIGMVLCLTLATINAYYGQFPEAVVTLAMAGALFGFLRYNFAPATIYLGDAGSMVIGLVIGAIALQTNLKTPAFVAMVVPLAVWAVPILDSGAAIVRRRLTGRSIFAPDRGHLHHALLTRGWTVPQASMFITLICAVTCLSAVLGVIWQNELIVVVTVVLVVAFLISSRTFGHVEYELLRARLRQSGLTFSSNDPSGAGRQHGAVRLQGSHEWEVLWDSIVEAAPSYGLTKLQLTIHMPRVHEAFYASWRAPKGAKPIADSSWRVTHPLTFDGEVVGKLDIVGLVDDHERSTLSQIAQVLDFLEPIEDEVREVKRSLLLSHVAKKNDAPVAPPTSIDPKTLETSLAAH